MKKIFEWIKAKLNIRFVGRSYLHSHEYFLLLTSYCAGQNKNCSDKFPCDDCLKMCNIIKVKAIGPYTIENYGGFEYNKKKVGE
jgi:hypothetical protein